jgi:hypothetical protein
VELGLVHDAGSAGAVPGGGRPRLLGRPLKPAEAHWDRAYRETGVTTVSWFQPQPSISLELIDLLGVQRSSPVIDVGGGASTLVDRLIADGFTDVTVLDISEYALGESEARIGPSSSVTWLRQDLLTWRPSRTYALWHDRATFHFLVDRQEQDRYLRLLVNALQPSAAVILATFDKDGPERCSGLPVARYSATELAERLGGAFEVVATRREQHSTPRGALQPFTWLACRRVGAVD